MDGSFEQRSVNFDQPFEQVVSSLRDKITYNHVRSPQPTSSPVHSLPNLVNQHNEDPLSARGMGNSDTPPLLSQRPLPGKPAYIIYNIFQKTARLNGVLWSSTMMSFRKSITMIKSRCASNVKIGIERNWITCVKSSIINRLNVILKNARRLTVSFN